MSHRINLCRGLAYQMQRALQGLPPIPPRKWWVEVWGTKGWVLRNAFDTVREAQEDCHRRALTGTAPSAIRIRPYWSHNYAGWRPFVGNVAPR